MNQIVETLQWIDSALTVIVILLLAILVLQMIGQMND